MNTFDDTIGIFPGDLVVKAAIELGINDMRKNPWVIDDVFRVLRESPMLRHVYGEKEISRAREFILNNKIPVYLRHRVDKQDFPCITISIGESYEDKDLATLGDLSVCVDDLDPMEIGKSIKYIIPPFNPTSYDKVQGIVEVPEDIEEFAYIAPGMIAVDPDTGGGFKIIEKIAPNSFRIQAGAELPKKIGVVPAYQLYRARRERAISQETYNIGCHTQDPATLIFLYSVVKYALYRYREGLLEANNFQLSKLRVTDLIRNEAFNVENVYSRWIILSGQVEESWVKSPKRTIETVVIKDGDADAEAGEDTEGIKYLSSDPPEGYEDENGLWVTIDEE
jgi:hypothetical protein